MISVSIAIPALNEENTIRDTFISVLNALERCENISKYEIILINDGSTDNTLRIMGEIAYKNEFVKVIDNKINMGLGYSYKRAMEEATGDYYSWVPSDNSFPVDSLFKLYKQIGDADIILHYPEIKNRRFYRIWLSSLYTKLLNLLFRTSRVKYYNGLAIYMKSDITDIDIRALGFAFQAELLIKALKKKTMTLTQIPVFTVERLFGSTKLFKIRNVLDIFRTIYFLYRDLNPAPFPKVRG